MSRLSVYVDDATMLFLNQQSILRNKSTEELAEIAVAEYCLEMKKRIMLPSKDTDQ